MATEESSQTKATLEALKTEQLHAVACIASYSEIGKVIRMLRASEVGQVIEMLEAKRAEISDEWDAILRRDSMMCAEIDAAEGSTVVPLFPT